MGSRLLIRRPGARRAARSRGFTFVELLAVLTILGILGTLGTRSASEAMRKSKIRRATVDVLDLQARIDEYALSADVLPSTLADIGAGGRLDPWGRPYEYVPFANEDVIKDARQDKFLKPLNSTYDLYSRGADGLTDKSITKDKSQDDVIRANDGGYVGLARLF